jgi:HNH endonuclease
MFTGDQLAVFNRYENAGAHAFSRGLVSDEDKDIYQEIFLSLQAAAKASIDNENFAEWFETWHARFGRDGGVQGQRPVDLWVSIINREPDAFGRFPQVYAIASSGGLEIGFSFAIHEDDYYNLSVKQKNREIIPILYRKLPDPGGEFVEALDAALLQDGGWQFGLKTRQGSRGDFSSLSQLIVFLRSAESSVRGGGSIYKVIEPGSIQLGGFHLDAVFAQTVSRFAPLMRVLRPSASEQVRLSDIDVLHETAGEIPEYAPKDEAEGRRKILQSVAVRQGQAKFREKLLDAYDYRCAITGTPIPVTLQAAHIVPYNGPETNSVQNGLLLRADIHNLFDLGLIQVDPDTLQVLVSDELLSTSFRKLNGRKLRKTKSQSQKPSRQALALRRQLFRVG